jgi:hypothetical protein
MDPETIEKVVTALMEAEGENAWKVAYELMRDAKALASPAESPVNGAVNELMGRLEALEERIQGVENGREKANEEGVKHLEVINSRLDKLEASPPTSARISLAEPIGFTPECGHSYCGSTCVKEPHPATETTPEEEETLTSIVAGAIRSLIIAAQSSGGVSSMKATHIMTHLRAIRSEAWVEDRKGSISSIASRMMAGMHIKWRDQYGYEGGRGDANRGLYSIRHTDNRRIPAKKQIINAYRNANKR